MDEEEAPIPPIKKGEWFFIFLATLAIYIVMMYYFPVNDLNSPYFSESPTQAKDEERAVRLLEKHLAVPAVKEKLANRLVVVKVTNDPLLTPNASIGLKLFGDSYTIFFLSTFIEELDDQQISAVLGHELGHALLGHLDNPNLDGFEKRMPRHDEIHCDCIGLYLAGKDAMRSAMQILFTKENIYIDKYLNRLEDTVCKEDKVFEQAGLKSAKVP